MSRQEWIRGGGRQGVALAPVLLGIVFGALALTASARGQAPANPAPPQAGPIPTAPAPGAVVQPATPPGTAVTGPEIPAGAVEAAGAPTLPPDVQIVRFQGPSGVSVEVLGPNPEPAPIGDGGGIATVGLKRGVGYRLRVTGIPERPGAELFPAIEVVGHLHRPKDIDPAKYPIRVVFTQEDLYEVVDQGRLVTKVIYLEDPEQALPIKLSKDQIPAVTLNPTEQPLAVGAALGRVVAIVRIGGRRPTIEEIQAGAAGDLGIDSMLGPHALPCPFTATDGDPCRLPCGPVCGTPPPPGRRWLPRDEYLCDGGDHGSPAQVGGDGGLKGIDPRDAVVRFDIGTEDRAKPRVLPTNRVCVYAPRFAEVRVSTGTNQAVEIHGIARKESLARSAQTDSRSGPKRLVQNQAPQLARDRDRASGMKGRVFTGESSDLRGTRAFDNAAHVTTGAQKQGAEIARNRSKAGLLKDKIRLDGIKSAESTVMTGLVQGTGEAVMARRPDEMKGIETPPNRPGLAVIKRVSATEAEPGDTLTFVITYRNMGNTPIRSVTIVDSLLPRLEYVKGSAKGPKGTTFTAADNRAGSDELKWVLPGVLAPGATGYVTFQALVR